MELQKSQESEAQVTPKQTDTAEIIAAEFIAAEPVTPSRVDSGSANANAADACLGHSKEISSRSTSVGSSYPSPGSAQDVQQPLPHESRPSVAIADTEPKPNIDATSVMQPEPNAVPNSKAPNNKAPNNTAPKTDPASAKKGPQPRSQVISILDRRRQLSRRRRVRFWQAVWRTSTILGVTAVLGWAVSQPEWQVQTAEQVKFVGNTSLSQETLDKLTPLHIPTSLIRIRPRAIARQLQEKAHIRSVSVSRQLLPPRVNIFIQERSPVARIDCGACTLEHLESLGFSPSPTLLIDTEGIVLPVSSYQGLKTEALPSLVVRGYLNRKRSNNAPGRPATQPASAQGTDPGGSLTLNPNKQRQWRAMISHLLQSPISIHEMDWRDPQNLKLNTPLGWVHLGSDSKQLPEQLQALGKMRSLGTKIDLKTIAYIDVSTPEDPVLELKSPIKKQLPPS